MKKKSIVIISGILIIIVGIVVYFGFQNKNRLKFKTFMLLTMKIFLVIMVKDYSIVLLMIFKKSTILLLIV